MGTPRLHNYEKRGQALPPHGASVRASGTSASRGVAIYIEARPLLLEASAYAVTGNLEGGGSGELSTLRQMTKVPNEPGLSPNNGLGERDQSMASNPREGQAKDTGAKTTSPDGKAGHIKENVCHRVRQEERQV